MGALRRIAEAHHEALDASGSDWRTPYAWGTVASAATLAVKVVKPDWINLNGMPTTLITAAGIMAAFLFGLQTMLYERAIDIEATDQPAASERARRLEYMASHSAYEAVLAGLVVVALGMAELLSGVPVLAEFLILAGIGFTTVFVITALTIVDRVLIDSLDRLRSSRTRR